MGKISVQIATRYTAEKKYILEVMLREFLGLDIQVKTTSGQQHFQLNLENGKSLKFTDYFFSHAHKSTYLDEDYLPKDPLWLEYDGMEQSIPVLYGMNEVDENEKGIHCKADIFASAFFMLTRWEEVVVKDRDAHNRFPVEASYAHKHGFLQRVVVNEYVEFIWILLKKAGYEGERKQWDYQITVTHDVDYIQKWPNVFALVKTLGGDLLRRKSFKLAMQNIKWYVGCLQGKRKDPYDTFDYLMDQSEKNGVKSHFFLMGGGKTKYDNRYKPNGKKLMGIVKNIHERGHFTGIHPSYNSHTNVGMLHLEKAALEKITERKITMGRHHYLRFSMPQTWQNWEDAGLVWDSTMYYTNDYGFKTGTCYPFPVFNVESRQQLNLKEHTMCLMDVSLYGKDIATHEPLLKAQIDTIKKYGGEYVILWHNSNLATPDWLELKGLYERLLEYGKTV